MNHVRSHWSGRQSLAQAFWINFLLVSLIVIGFLSWLNSLDKLAFTTFLTVISGNAVIFTWQTTGLIRCGESHIAAHGSPAPIWGSYVSVVIFLFVVGTQWIGLYQQTIPRTAEELFTTRMDRLHASTYNLRQSEDSTTLELDGEIALGSTRIVDRLLEDQPTIRKLALNSLGGNIYEARGIARLVLEHRIDTHIDGTCSSACTIVFVSGVRRTLGTNGRVGFHQYRLDGIAQLPNVDIDAEQSKDRAFFEMRAVSEEFLEKMFNTPHSGIWYPDRLELLSAGVITEQSPSLPVGR